MYTRCQTTLSNSAVGIYAHRYFNVFLVGPIREMTECEDECSGNRASYMMLQHVDTPCCCFYRANSGVFATRISFGGCANTDFLPINILVLTRVYEYLSIQSRLQFLLCVIGVPCLLSIIFHRATHANYLVFSILKRSFQNLSMDLSSAIRA